MSEFLLIFFVIILLFSVFRRYIFFFLMNALAKRLFNHAQKQQAYQKQQMRRPEHGATRVDNPSSGPRKPRDDGEYVDFEEVKD